MFDFVRNNTKILMVIMFLLIIPAFVLVGVDGYTGMVNQSKTVAQIGSQKVTQDEWDDAHKREVDRMRASMPGIDVQFFDTPQARYATLERLVRDRVMMDAVQSNNVFTTDVRLARELQQNPTIAALRNADGSLDMNRYRQLAASIGLTPEGLEAQVRIDLSMRQLEAGIVSTGLAPSKLTTGVMQALFEKREIQIARFEPSAYKAKVTLTDADLQAYYQANSSTFQTPESANIEYLVLDLDAVKKTIQLNEADLKTYYDQNIERLGGLEERRASHILINAPQDAASAEREKAKQRAQSLLDELRKTPQSFAELARQHSQDPGSAVNGGDLDFFARGAMVKPFEDAAFSLKKGEISEVVESEFGYHIIQLTDIKTPKRPSFQELRPSLEAELKNQQAQAKFAELAETFTNTVYEQSDSLQPVAQQLKLEIKTASNVQRKPVTGAPGLLGNAKLLEALFSNDSLQKKRNTEAIETASNQLVSARIVQHTPARIQALDEVRAQVKDRLVAQRAAEMASKEGKERLALWQANPGAAILPASVVVSRDQAQNLLQPALEAVLRADTSKLPVWVGVDQKDAGYLVVKINQVLPRPAMDEARAQQERAQLAQWLAAAENQAYYQHLQSRAKVQMKVDKPVKTPPAQTENSL
jgi:peptidyl-prolyl cis-trans isomerase D